MVGVVTDALWIPITSKNFNNAGQLRILFWNKINANCSYTAVCFKLYPLWCIRVINFFRDRMRNEQCKPVLFGKHK